MLPDVKVHVTADVIPELSVTCGAVQTAATVDILDVVFFVCFEGQDTKTGSSVSEWKKQEHYILILHQNKYTTTCGSDDVITQNINNNGILNSKV